MIKGLKPRLAEAGKIKIGGLGAERKSKRGNTFRLPVKYDHFLVTKTMRGDKGDLLVDEGLMEDLPKDRDGKVRAIPIVLHSDEIEEVFPTAYNLYSGKKLACRGDGEKATRWELRDEQANGRIVKVRTGRTKEMDCPCPYLGAKSGPICKPHGTLHCSIAVPGRAVAGALYRWRTTSIISIERMIASLQQILSITGSLKGIPLTLKVEPVRVEPKDAAASTVYCCHLELRAADIMEVQRQALEMKRMRALVQGEAPLPYPVVAPGSDLESDEEQAEIADEFYPEEEPDVPFENVRASAGKGNDALKSRLAGEEEDPFAGEPFDPETGEVFDTEIAG